MRDAELLENLLYVARSESTAFQERRASWAVQVPNRFDDTRERERSLFIGELNELFGKIIIK